MAINQINEQTKLKDWMQTINSLIVRSNDVNDKIESGEIGGTPEIPQPSTSLPRSPGNANSGSSLKYAREDHVHPAQNIEIKPDAGGADAVSISSDLILNASSKRKLSVVPSRSGLKIYLPDPSTIEEDGVSFVIANAGSYDIQVVGSNGSNISNEIVYVKSSKANSYILVDKASNQWICINHSLTYLQASQVMFMQSYASILYDTYDSNATIPYVKLSDDIVLCALMSSDRTIYFKIFKVDDSGNISILQTYTHASENRNTLESMILCSPNVVYITTFSYTYKITLSNYTITGVTEIKNTESLNVYGTLGSCDKVIARTSSTPYQIKLCTLSDAGLTVTQTTSIYFSISFIEKTQESSKYILYVNTSNPYFRTIDANTLVETNIDITELSSLYSDIRGYRISYIKDNLYFAYIQYMQNSTQTYAYLIVKLENNKFTKYSNVIDSGVFNSNFRNIVVKYPYVYLYMSRKIGNVKDNIGTVDIIEIKDNSIEHIGSSSTMQMEGNTNYIVDLGNYLVCLIGDNTSENIIALPIKVSADKDE